MNFFTQIELPDYLPRLAPANRLMLLGSCFASEMGQRLTDAKFRCDVNPYGVLYNPASISIALREMVAGKTYGQEDLFLFRQLWHSAMHHGDFSSALAGDALESINLRLKCAHDTMKHVDCLLLTFGTAWVYEAKETGRIVGNCHKQPEKNFTRRRLSVEEIVLDYSSLLVPKNVFYFPAYELLMDELRDYRFYAEDLVHPSAVAIRHVWERFVQTCISTEALPIMEESENIHKALSQAISSGV